MQFRVYYYNRDGKTCKLVDFWGHDNEDTAMDEIQANFLKDGYITTCIVRTI